MLGCCSSTTREPEATEGLLQWDHSFLAAPSLDCGVGVEMLCFGKGPMDTEPMTALGSKLGSKDRNGCLLAKSTAGWCGVLRGLCHCICLAAGPQEVQVAAWIEGGGST